MEQHATIAQRANSQIVLSTVTVNEQALLNFIQDALFGV
jgi:hypothetical protein